MDRTDRRGARRHRHFPRLAAGAARLTAAGLAICPLTAALLLVWVAAAQASVWVIPTMGRAFPDDQAGGGATRSPSTPPATSTRACRSCCAAAAPTQ